MLKTLKWLPPRRRVSAEKNQGCADPKVHLGRQREIKHSLIDVGLRKKTTVSMKGHSQYLVSIIFG